MGEEKKDFSGVWRRVTIDENYDDWWKFQEQGWMKRKAAAYASLTRTIVQRGDEVEKDHTLLAGLLNVEVAYHIYSSEEEANKAREEGKYVEEETAGTTSQLVAWYDKEKEQLVLYRTFPGKNWVVYYRSTFSPDNADQLTVDLQAFSVDRSTSCCSLETFERVPQ